MEHLSDPEFLGSTCFCGGINGLAESCIYRVRFDPHLLQKLVPISSALYAPLTFLTLSTWAASSLYCVRVEAPDLQGMWPLSILISKKCDCRSASGARPLGASMGAYIIGALWIISVICILLSIRLFISLDVDPSFEQHAKKYNEKLKVSNQFLTIL